MVHFGTAATDDDVARARDAAERAMALAPDKAFSHVAMGYFHHHGRKDYAAAERDYVSGTSLQMDVALIHAMIGDRDQAMTHAERSLSWPDYYTAQRVALDPWLKVLTTHSDFEEMTRRAAARRASLFERVD